MKKKTYWIVAALLLVAAVLFMLFGNGATEDETPAASETTMPTEAPAETPTETISIMEEIAEETGEGSSDNMDGEFVPSVTYKGGPAIISAVMNEKVVTDCLIVTTVEEAMKKETDITQDERDLLVEVYNQLVDGTMVLPVEGDYVIREFVDVNFRYKECRTIDAHNEKDVELAEEQVLLTIDLEFEVEAGEDFVILAYLNEEWVEIPAVINEDGTVTCDFEELCPVALVIRK